MGLSSNQARFLSLTSRQIDLEHRVQQICQRRLRLSNEMQRAARSYNDQTNDRRLFINTLGGFSSAQNNVIGPITHDNLLDNNRYEFITADNLYDNGYYVFQNGSPLNGTQDDLTKPIYGTKIVTTENATGNTLPFSNGSSAYVVGNQFNANGFLYKILTATSAAGGTTYEPANAGAPTAPSAVGGQNYTMTNQPTATGPAGSTTLTTTPNHSLGFSYPGGNQVETFSRIDTTTVITEIAGNPFINSVTPGSQTLAGATQVTTTAQLQAALAANQNIILMGNIDFNNQTINDSLVGSYSGNLEGNGYKISNININTNASSYNGLIGNYSGGFIKNLALDDIHVVSSATYTGTLIGKMDSGTIDNVMVTNSSVDGGTYSGGFMGWQQSGVVQNSYSAANVTNVATDAGGFAGVSSGNINHSFATGDVGIVGGGGNAVGGLIGVLISGGAVTIDYCYATGDVSSVGSGRAGGLIGAESDDQVAINNSYATGRVTAESGIIGGLVAGPTLSTTITNSTWDVTSTGCSNAQGSGSPTLINSAGLTSAQMNNDATVQSYLGSGSPWDYSTSGAPVLGNSASSFSKSVFTQEYQYTITTPPTTTSTTYSCTASEWSVTTSTVPDPSNIIGYEQIQTTTSITSDELEAGLRDGSIKLAKDADAMTQDPVNIGSKSYEYVDWRIQPVISDDLYEANDEAAQYLYEKVIRDVNAQDKQLQLEQTSVETEYKAITSEKEAVEKIIDTNAKNSFKYFS